MRDRPHDKAIAEQFHADPDYAVELLIDVRCNGDSAELSILLRQMAKEFGQDQSGVLIMQTARNRLYTKYGIFYGACDISCRKILLLI